MQYTHMDCIAPTTPIIPSPNNIHTNQIPSQNNLFIQQNPIHSIPTISPIPTINTISVSYKTYLNILNSSNKCLKIIKCIITILLMIGAQICLVTSQFWLGLCASQPPQKQQSNKTFEYIYYLLAICTIVLSLWRCAFIFNELLHSAEILHNEMFIGVLYSKMIFFESNPLGRILNRFSKDQQLIDDKLPLATYDWIESITTCFIVFILIRVLNSTYNYGNAEDIDEDDDENIDDDVNILLYMLLSDVDYINIFQMLLVYMFCSQMLMMNITYVHVNDVNGNINDGNGIINDGNGNNHVNGAVFEPVKNPEIIWRVKYRHYHHHQHLNHL